MGKIGLFQINFTNSTDCVYFPGQNVRGVVSLTVNEALKARQVRLEVNGCAETRWTETRTRTVSNGRGGTRTQSYTETYSAYENYVSMVISLLPTDASPTGDSFYIQPGSYSMPFSFQLPSNCPSSFEGIYGHIRYATKAIIDRPWHFDSKVKALFTVVSLYDLNHDPEAIRPLNDFKTKRLGCMCCVSGELTCTVHIDRSGYVPGESIPLNFEVVNNSSTYISYVKTKLVENVVFVARHGWSEHTKMSSRMLAEQEAGAIEPSESQFWHGRCLAIPPVAPTLKYCSIIKGSYELQIKANPDGCHTSLKMFFPIIIGNVPFRSVYQSVRPSAPISSEGQTVPSVPPLPEYPDLPPPSYEEAVFGGGDVRDEADDEHTAGPTSFAPRYPYYKYLNVKLEVPENRLAIDG